MCLLKEKAIQSVDFISFKMTGNQKGLLCFLELAGQVHLAKGLQAGSSHYVAVLCHTLNADT